MHALIFDLDRTLIDTVYAHVFSWQRAFEDAGMAIVADTPADRDERRVASAGAYRVCRDASELLTALDELGVLESPPQ